MKEPVTYRPFRAQPVLQQGLLPIERDNGDLERRVAAGLARIADMYAGKAEQEAEMKARMDVQRDVYSGAPTPATVTGGEPAGTASPNGQAGHVKGAQSGVRVYTGDAYGQVAALLRHEEGFRDTPYWDTNAYRVGYGSDTTTLADGRVVKVTPGMKITRDDAERDLVYRLSQREGAQVRRQIGEQAFAAMPANVQAGLLSVGYNYGSLPSDVLAAAKTGDPAQIAAAVRALPANSKRRQREADLIAGNGHAAVDGVATLPNRDGPVRVVPVIAPVKIEPGKAGTWRPTGLNTIYGRIYDVEGTRTFLQLAKQTIVQEQAQLYDQYKDNPAQLKQAYDQLLEQHKREGTYFDEIAPEYEHSFAMSASAYLGRARSEQLQRQRETDAVEFKDRISSMEDRKSQMLVGLDPNDETAASALADAQNDIDNHYDSAVSRGMMTPEEAGNAKRKSRSDMVTGFYLKQTAGKNSDDLLKLRDTMAADYAAGKLEGVTADDWERITSGLDTAITGRKTADKQASAALSARRDEAFTKALRGEPLSLSEMAQIRTDAATAPDGQAIVASMDARMRLAGALRTQPIGAVESRLQEILKREDGSVSAEDLAFARDKITEVRKTITTDPLGAAEAYGLIPPAPPIDLTQMQDPAALRDALAYRRGAAVAAADHFGVQPRYFRPGEAQQLVDQAMNNPDAMVAFTNNAISAFGKDAPAAMREISEAGPVMAHAVGVGNAMGDPSIARDVAQLWTMKQRKDYAVKMPESGTLETKGSVYLAGALSTDPAAQVAALQTANLLFEKAAADQGFDPKDIKTEGSVAEIAYFNALDRALGGQVINGKATGGIGLVNDRQIVVPALMDKERPQQLLYQLNEQTLAKLPPMGSGNGVPLKARQLRNAYLTSVGDGLYRISLNNPDEEEPDYIVEPSGRPYVLDIRQLDTLIRDQTKDQATFGYNPSGAQ